MLPPLTEIPAGVVSPGDYEALARERLGEGAWAYLSGGAADEITLRKNRAAFERMEIVPRLFRDLSGATTEASLFGRKHPHPVFIAPMAYHGLFHPGGELATAAAAAAFDTTMVVSTQAGTPLEEIAASTQSPLWFQLYIQPDRGFTLDLVQRAEAAGYQALVVTADAPLTGLRNREQRAGFQLPPGIEAVNLRGMRQPAPNDRIFGSELVAAAPTWQDLAWLQSHTRLPVIVKGILSPDDAAIALDQGVSGIAVSNHGGRTLDTAPATLDVLPAITARIQGAVPVFMDGGIRRGTDIFKALACGADAVFVGRPILHGLTAAGALGVAHVLKLLLAELQITMILAGCATLNDVRASRSSEENFRIPGVG